MDELLWGAVGGGGRRLEILLKSLVIAPITKCLLSLNPPHLGLRDVRMPLFLMIESFYSWSREI